MRRPQRLRRSGVTTSRTAVCSPSAVVATGEETTMRGYPVARVATTRGTVGRTPSTGARTARRSSTHCDPAATFRMPRPGCGRTEPGARLQLPATNIACLSLADGRIRAVARHAEGRRPRSRRRRAERYLTVRSCRNAATAATAVTPRTIPRIQCPLSSRISASTTTIAVRCRRGAAGSAAPALSATCSQRRAERGELRLQLRRHRLADRNAHVVPQPLFELVALRAPAAAARDASAPRATSASESEPSRYGCIISSHLSHQSIIVVSHCRSPRGSSSGYACRGANAT